MNASILVVTVSFLSTAYCWAQAPAAPLLPPKPAAMTARLTSKDIRVLPFCREFEHQKFKANGRELPNELTAVMSDRVHLYGKRKGETVALAGRKVGHVGKVVLLTPGGRAGGLVAKVASMEDVTYYFAVLELDDDTLDTKWLTLAANKPCQWSVKSEGGQTTLKIVSGATEVASLSAATEKVKGYGFAATVREKGNEADLTVTFN